MAIFYEVPLTFTVVAALDTTAPQAGTNGSSVNILLGLDASGNVYVNGVAADGGAAVSSVFGRAGAVVATTGDYTVAKVTGAAPLASPTFTGTVTVPTPSTSDNSTKAASTAYVQAQGYAPEVAAPASAVAAGVAGQIAYDATHIYVCIATNTWVRATLATW